MIGFSHDFFIHPVFHQSVFMAKAGKHSISGLLRPKVAEL
jgi:hypothetical protein